MMKKTVSNALLSLFMDKSAREKLNRVKTSARTSSTPSLSTPPPPRVPTAPPRPPATDDAHAHLDEKLENAKRTLTSDRRALIRSALKIQRDQAKMLNEIDAEDRDRLRAIALSRLAPHRKGD
ncbi:hypothetical protein [Varunaivibrio sulfuroxidans]|nr:hypothetical protein [Varunaivibrio sulfuroxidans]